MNMNYEFQTLKKNLITVFFFNTKVGRIGI